MHKVLDSLIPHKESLAVPSCIDVQPPTTDFNNVQPPTTDFNDIQPPTTDFNCEICFKSFTEMNKLEEHLTLAHFKDKLLEDNFHDDKGCMSCSQVFQLGDDLLLHLSADHNALVKYLPELYPNLLQQQTSDDRANSKVI